jgi:DNA-binding MarR family transcriptional regulator
MSSPRQDPISAIEHALITMRRDQHRGRHHLQAHDHEHPPFQGGPPWMAALGGGRMRGGAHDRSLGGAARFRLLDALLNAEAADQRMGVSEVADAIAVDQPRASRLVNESVERGLVTRRADERDARRSVIQITDAGRDLLESARSSRRSAVTDAVAEFTPDELQTFATLLTRFVAAWPR